LDGYIQLGMHFLAVKVREPEAVTGEGDYELPPLQFTCQTTQRLYPMIISQISAAEETEVMIYIVSDHRAQAANLSNELITEEELEYDPDSESNTNYEALFLQKIDQQDGQALITEYAYDVDLYTFSYVWPDMPTGLIRALWEKEHPDSMILTRLRTVIAPQDMTVDFEFEDYAGEEHIYGSYTIDLPREGRLTGVVQGLGMLLLCGLCLVPMRRCRK